MSEPESKRPKMSAPGDINNKYVMLFDPRATVFERIVKMKAFIDHSNVIKRILEGPSFKFVVAPSRFCKSTNMAMAQSFLEIEVHKDGKNEGDAIRDVMREATSVEELKGPNLKNYDLFCVPEPKCKILNEEEFVLKHFGRYPVIALDFAVEAIRSFNYAIDHCLCVIHEAYLDHEYLRRSIRLDTADAASNTSCQNECKKWCDVQKYREGDYGSKQVNVKSGLKDLTKFLHSHFGRKVVLLVDEFDAIVSRAKFRVESDQELTDISELVTGMLGFDIKGNKADQHVEYVLLTGIETISGLGCSSLLAGVTKYNFLDREEFIGFYGAQEDDVRNLITTLKHKQLLRLFEHRKVEQIMEEIMEQYNGYYSRGGESVSILSLWSVLHYLQYGKAEVHWTKPPALIHIESFLKHPSIAAKILQLVGKKAGEETILVQIPESINIREVRGLVKQDAGQEPSVDLSLSYLKELGYLSHVKIPKKGSDETSEKGSDEASEKGSDEASEKVELKLANEEIRRELIATLVNPNVKIVGFDFVRMQQMSGVFNDILSISNITEETYHKYLQNIYDILKTLFTQGFAQYDPVDLNESMLMSLMVIALSKVKCLKRFASDHPIKDSTGKCLTPGKNRVDIWLQHKKTNSVVIFELKFNRLDYRSAAEELKRTSLYALNKILQSYVIALDVLKPPNYILFGLSMDAKSLPSISCLLNTRDVKKTICLSETELTKFKDYYEGCINLLKGSKN